MRVFALGDLHLPSSRPKTMEIFGEAWRDHPSRIAENWRRSVGDDDLVVVPGDISWAMRLEEAEEDLAWLGALPGTKVLLRGNHDYWWASAAKIRKVLAPSMVLLQGVPVVVGDVAVAGTRGWRCPGSWEYQNGELAAFSPEDEKIYRREAGRLALCLDGLGDLGGKRLVIALHFPPWNEKGEPSEFSRLIAGYPGAACVYGHLHGEPSIGAAFRGDRDGVRFHLASADAAGFAPLELSWP